MEYTSAIRRRVERVDEETADCRERTVLSRSVSRSCGGDERTNGDCGDAAAGGGVRSYDQRRTQAGTAVERCCPHHGCSDEQFWLRLAVAAKGGGARQYL